MLQQKVTTESPRSTKFATANAVLPSLYHYNDFLFRDVLGRHIHQFRFDIILKT